MCEIPGELHFHEKFQAKQKVEIELELEYGGSLSITHHNFRCYCSRYYQRTQCLKISKKVSFLKMKNLRLFGLFSNTVLIHYHKKLQPFYKPCLNIQGVPTSFRRKNNFSCKSEISKKSLKWHKTFPIWSLNSNFAFVISEQFIAKSPHLSNLDQNSNFCIRISE